MIEKIVNLAEDLLRAHPHDTDLFKEVNIRFYHFKQIYFGVLCARLYFKTNKMDDLIAKLYSNHLISSNSKLFYEEYKGTFKILEEAGFYNINTLQAITDLYEQLLEYNVDIGNSKLENTKNQRQNTGSFYTPIELSETIVDLTFSQYIYDKIHEDSANLHNNKLKTNLFRGIRILDPSCGCGEFLECAKRYLYEHTNLTEDEISNSLYGIDIDPTAVLISIFKTSSDATTINYKNYIVGNPLLSQTGATLEEKEMSYALGDIYSDVLGAFSKEMIGSFDIVLGNPPWDKIRFEERKFFQSTAKQISNIPQKYQREREIELIKQNDPLLYDHYMKIKTNYSTFKEKLNHPSFLHNSLFGELNACALFLELSYILSKQGNLGIIIKTSIITTPNSKSFFNWLQSTCCLKQIYMFDNKKRIFDIDTREKFSVLIMGKAAKETFNLHLGLIDIESMNDANFIPVGPDVLKIINPETELIPNVKTNEEMMFLLKVHTENRTFDSVFTMCHYGRIVHLTSHSDHIFRTPADNRIGIFEGKMIGPYDECYSTFENVSEKDRYSGKGHSIQIAAENDENHLPVCRYYIEKDFWYKISSNYPDKYSLYWRSLTSSTNSRTMIATVATHRPTSQSMQLIQNSNHYDLLLILGIFNSSFFDHILRLKLTGIDLTQKIVRQMPVPSKEKFEMTIEFENQTDTLSNHIVKRVLSLIRRSSALDLSVELNLKPISNKGRDVIIAEIDELVRISYG